MRTRIFGVDEIQGRLIRREAKTKQVTAHAYEKAHRLHCASAFLEPHDSKQSLVMQVNHGRWLTVCPECETGITVGRLWTKARCFGCGAVFSEIVWPKNIPDIEHVLLLRPLSNQNWLPTQTLGMLMAENLEHGLKGL